MSPTEIATVDNQLMFDPRNLTKETIKKYLCPNATEQDLTMGLEIAKMFNLNPLKREIYFVRYTDKPDDKMQVLVGYEVYLKRAERSGKYNGLEVTSEGSIKEGNLKAVVKIYRKDWTNPLIHECYYNEYVQMKPKWANGQKIGEEPNRFWATKPMTMIKKVTISQAFRLAFPDEFDGLPYTSDEVVDQERLIDIPIVTPIPLIPPDEQTITKEQHAALLNSLSKNGFTEMDLKNMTFAEWAIDDTSKLQNKHILPIKQFFKKVKTENNARA